MKHLLPPLFRTVNRRAAASTPASARARFLRCLGVMALVLSSQSAMPASAVDTELLGALQLPASNVQQFTLRNGMTLIVKPDHRAPTAVNMLWVRVGSMDEVDGTTGVAHLLEHMMFKGTPSVPEGEFSRRVAALGGTENAFTTKDYTGFYQQIPANRLQDMMRLEADRFANNQWSDSVFATELEVVKEERRLRTEDEPLARLDEVLDATVYLASPYRRPVVGWMSDLEAVTAQDARDFYQTWYTPANAAVVVAGDVDVDQVHAWAEATYGSVAQRPVPPRKPRIEPPQLGMRRLLFKAPAEQAYVALAFKVPGLSAAAYAPLGSDDSSGAHSVNSSDADALALTVLAAVLSGYDGARLERALTQSRDPVADSAGAQYGLAGRGPQLFTLFGVPGQGKTAAQVEQALRAEITRLAQKGVSDSELRRVKVQWIAGEIYKRDSVFDQANALGAAWINGFAPDGEAQLIARLRRVTAQQVQAVAARYFGDDALTVATLLPQPVDKNRAPRAPTPATGPIR